MKRILMLLAVALTLGVFSSAATITNAPTDYNGKTFAVVSGTIYEGVIDKHFPDSTKLYFSDTEACLEAVSGGNADATLVDSVAAVPRTAQGGYANLTHTRILEEKLANELGAASNKQTYVNNFNDFLKKMEKDGMIADMEKRWLGSSTKHDLPSIPAGNGAKTLVVATTGEQRGFSFYGDNGVLAGFDIELAYRFAAYLGTNVKFVVMDFDMLIPYVAAGKADMIISELSITDERKRKLFFSDPYLSGGISLITRSGDVVSQSGTRSYADFIGKRFAVTAGSSYEEAAQSEPFFATELIEYETEAESIDAILSDEADAMLTSQFSAVGLVGQKQNGKLEIFLVPSVYYSSLIGVIASDSELIDKFNVFMKEMQRDGTQAEMTDRWLSGEEPTMPRIETSWQGSRVRVAVDPGGYPYTYVVNGEYRGYDVEQITRFVASMGREAQFVPMSLNEIFDSVSRGETDMGVGYLSITEERSEKVLFSKPYTEERLVLIAKKPDVEKLEQSNSLNRITVVSSVAIIAVVLAMAFIDERLREKRDQDN
ncbi:MAG: transporter substrate-binding domain-containing protein [Oscillospiraceae bacterium]|jgi:polar amino acid transport system substrate-binding protein|nr:transporter substrate-binding domain-containing protein [Oscillospiraceae bacterium]